MANNVWIQMLMYAGYPIAIGFGYPMLLAFLFRKRSIDTREDDCR